jgi:cytochrome c-type biogenesis protein CcmH/NrfF
VKISRHVLAVLLTILAFPAAAVQPDEVLADPALEARARALSANLRCMVCQNQSIDDSDADLARDLRVLVRERLTAGDSDRQVIDYVVARYGEFVLLKPGFNARNALLWGAPVLILLAGAAAAWSATRGRRAVATAPLTAEEKRALAKALDERS